MMATLDFIELCVSAFLKHFLKYGFHGIESVVDIFTKPRKVSKIEY